MKDIYRNKEILDQAGVAYTELYDGRILMFRNPDALYYPDNNKWVSGHVPLELAWKHKELTITPYYGNAHTFLTWLKNQ